jgi:hypothetical protein
MHGNWEGEEIMVMLYSFEVPLRDLGFLCPICLRPGCPDSYSGNPDTLKRLEEARGKLNENASTLQTKAP